MLPEDPTPLPRTTTEVGSPTFLTSPELPRWIDHPRVDSQAMFSAFLAYRGRCTGEAYTQLGHLYIIEHRHEPTVAVSSQVIQPQEIHSPGQPTRPCTAQSAHAATYFILLPYILSTRTNFLTYLLFFLLAI